MKLVLKYNPEVRIYTQQMKYESIFSFVKTSFQLEPQAISLTFEDEEGDRIYIYSQEDIDTMLQIFQHKEYIKIFVQNVKDQTYFQTLSPNPILEQQPQPRLIESKPKKSLSKHRSRSRKMKNFKEGEEKGGFKGEGLKKIQQFREIRHERSLSKGRQDKERGCGRKRLKFQQMNNLLNELVTKLVDQRLKVLLPCLKEKILKGQEPILPVHSDVIHTGAQCKGCNVLPITGIMYQCPKCSNFNLCQVCQQKIQHDHNLLKIKKVQSVNVQANEEVFQKFKQCFKGMFKSHHRRGDSSSSDKSQRKWKGHHYLKKVWGLSFLFEGKPEQYSAFVQANIDLKPREIYKKYAQQNNISDEQFNRRFVNLRCQKLSRCFGKEPQSFKQFVQSTIDLGQKDMMRIFYQSGFEKGQPNRQRCWKGGRFFNFRDACKQKRQEKSSDKCQKEVDKDQMDPSLVEQPKPRDSPEVMRAKGVIFSKMIEIFGSQNKLEYSKLIDNHFEQGQEVIIDLWINRLCSIKK